MTQQLKGEVRLERAKDLLLRTTKPIKQVAAASGFRNWKSFFWRLGIGTDAHQTDSGKRKFNSHELIVMRPLRSHAQGSLCRLETLGAPTDALRE